jgi:hypothetical protein
MKKILIVFFLCFSQMLFAQMPNDGIMMLKGEWCNALMYNHSQWKNYWEGTANINEPNLGTVTTQSVAVMSNYGISDRLNIITQLPYVWTKPSAGQFAGERGFQDISGWIKYRALKKDVFSGTLQVFGVVGGSLPVSNYVKGYLPFSIGIGSRTAQYRLLADFEHHTGIYVTGQASYVFRSNITVDKDVYQADGKLYYTNKVQVPNMVDAAGRIGYRHSYFRADVFIERFLSLSGDDIRPKDMPFPTNAMSGTDVGVYGKFEKKGYGVIAQLTHRIAGSNVGQATQIMLGISYAFQTRKSISETKTE